LTSGPLGKLQWTNRGVFYAELTPERPGSPAHWTLIRLSLGDGVTQPLFDLMGDDELATFDISPDGARIAIQPDAAARQTFSSNTGHRAALWAVKIGR
jgi:hypothetical protein